MSESHNIPVPTKIKIISSGLILALFLGGIFTMTWSVPFVHAQANPTGVPTIDSTITALEIRVKNLEDRKDLEIQTAENNVQQALIPVYIWTTVLGTLGASSAVGVWLWIRSFIKKTQTNVEEETRKKLDQAFYNADPLYFPIYAPTGEGFETEWNRLLKLGFKNLRPYSGLRESILDGIVIFQIPGKNYENQEDCRQAESALNALESFMVEYKTAQRKVAFILYIPGSGRLLKANDFAGNHDNVVIANMPVTIAEHTYALVRGLTALEMKKEGK